MVSFPKSADANLSHFDCKLSIIRLQVWGVCTWWKLTVFNVSKFTNETHYSLTKLLFSTPACKSRHVLMSADFESILEDLLGSGEGQEKNSGLRTGDEHLSVVKNFISKT